MTLLTNHINSTVRTSLNNRTPYMLAQLLVRSKLFDVMNFELIPSDKVVLSGIMFSFKEKQSPPFV
jgi:hypothetical protein